MIAKERMSELSELFWSETNDEETQQWRDELNEEEEHMVSDWDGKLASSMKPLCKKIIELEVKHRLKDLERSASDGQPGLSKECRNCNRFSDDR
ncbi:hypothetical protein ABWW58_02455 [Sporolactobacillus sp. STCC-11]|uniref:hypothetical protein n=1 Tax=Sporolactobacillus caesalpiniae TaxID=3230362 RepID=UPI003399B274